jgi:sucrose-phosphate synthase
VLANASLVISSTDNEIEAQYGLYNYYDPARITVIPPGTNLEQFHPPAKGDSFDFAKQVGRFLVKPDKPLILALSRPDERKNILALIEAFGESRPLQQAANLLIVAGSRDDIRDMGSGAQSVLTNILLSTDSYDPYGRIAYPKSHRADEVPEIYRLAAARRGVFINPALTEPFGLTLLEAAASGLPVVATENGGPVDIIANCNNGELIDPLDRDAIAAALLKLLRDREAWERASKNSLRGVRRHYSWQAHARSFLDKITALTSEPRPEPSDLPRPRTWRHRDRALFTDLEQNLVGNPVALQQFIGVMREHHQAVILGIATGRRIDTALSLLRKHGIPRPDVLISSLGTRIHYGPALDEDTYWAANIDHNWSPQRILRELEDLPGMMLQPKVEQTPFKISYYYDAGQAPAVDEIVMRLHKQDLTANVILASDQYLDILPSPSSKGQALRYVSQRLEFPLEQTLVAGGSGADEDMMRGNTLAVIVANRHHEELSELVEQERIYFAERLHALGILEAIEHYDFFGECGGTAGLMHRLLMGVLRGPALSLAKIGVPTGGHPVGMALWQVVTSSSLLLCLLLLQSRRPLWRSEVVRFGMVCGSCGVAFPAIALFWSAYYLPAGVVAIAFASMPLFTYLLSILLKIERGQRRRLLGVAIGLVAMALLVLPESALPAPGLAPWVLLALAASVSMSIENTYAGGYRPPGVGCFELSFSRQAAAVIPLLPLALLSGTALPVLEPWGTAQYAATGTGLLSGIAYTLLLFVIKSAGPVFASQTAYVITLAGVGWGMILFAETHSLYIWTALLLTLAGISMVGPRSPHRRLARAEG